MKLNSYVNKKKIKVSSITYNGRPSDTTKYRCRFLRQAEASLGELRQASCELRRTSCELGRASGELWRASGELLRALASSGAAEAGSGIAEAGSGVVEAGSGVAEASSVQPRRAQFSRVKLRCSRG